MAIHIGHRRAGWPGLLVAGGCFILPAALIVTLIAWAYVRLGKLPPAEAILYGIKPVIIAIIAQALWKLGHTAVKNVGLAAAAVAAVGLGVTGVNELVVLFGVASAVAVFRSGASWRKRGSHLLLGATAGPMAGGVAATTTAAQFGLWPMFLFFLKVGSVLFGSGYVLLAFLRADLVDRWGWLTESQLMDAVAVGRFTPGPVFTTATFIGYILGGLPGALVATVGIFLPAFFFVAISGPLVPRMRRSPFAGAFLDGLNVASLALMAVVTWQLGRAGITDWLTALLATASLVLLLWLRINSAWLVSVGALCGLVRMALLNG